MPSAIGPEALLPPTFTPSGSTVGYQGFSLNPGSIAWNGVRALKDPALGSNPSSVAYLPHLSHTCVMGLGSDVFSPGSFESSEGEQGFTCPEASAKQHLPPHTNLQGHVSPCNYLQGHRPPVTFLEFMSLGDYFVKERLVLARNGQAACARGVLK